MWQPLVNSYKHVHRVNIFGTLLRCITAHLIECKLNANNDAKRAKRCGKTAEQLPGEMSELVIVELSEVLVWQVLLQQGEKVPGIEKEIAGQLPTDA